MTATAEYQPRHRKPLCALCDMFGHGPEDCPHAKKPEPSRLWTVIVTRSRTVIR